MATNDIPNIILQESESLFEYYVKKKCNEYSVLLLAATYVVRGME